MEPGANSPDLVRFFRTLEAAPASVLMLDYDGTLAPFHVDPAQAKPYPGVLERITALLGVAGVRVVLVTGRSLDSLLPLLETDPIPEVWASHGREHRRSGGEVFLNLPDEAQLLGLAEARRRLEACRIGGRIEGKPFSVAIHVRGMARSEADGALEVAQRAWAEVASASDLEILPFDSGLELRAAGWTKGETVSAILDASEPEAAASYLGDDLTDEDAFRALEGRGLAVLVGRQWRPTAARAWLRPPEELMEFLDAWLRVCR